MSITIPGALADYLTDQFIGDEETIATLDAARRGRGRTLIIEPTSTRVLHTISRTAELILDNRATHTRAQIGAARLWISRAGHAPAIMAHRFDSTHEAYNMTQCRDDIRDGDVLIIESERVVGFLRTAWPAAITAERGELHGIDGDPRTLDNGKYAATIAHAEEIARDLEFELAAVEDEEAETELADAVAAIEQAEEADGTWRGEWIGEDADETLFALERTAEQGALFNERIDALAAVVVQQHDEADQLLADIRSVTAEADDLAAEVAVWGAEVDAVTSPAALEVTRASVDAYLARTYPALFAPEQPRALELEPALMWAVTHRVVIRGEWQGFIMCGLGRREAEDRASVLRYTGSKAVEVVLCEHGPHSHRDARLAARCEGCGYQIPRGEQWHDACRPRPRLTPAERARRAAERDAGYARALDASARVADLDGEPPF